MGLITQPETFGSMLEDLERRVRDLERGGGGLVAFRQVANLAANTWTATTYNGASFPPHAPNTPVGLGGEVTLGTSGSFTLTRSTTVLALATVVTQMNSATAVRNPIYIRITDQNGNSQANSPAGQASYGQTIAAAGSTTPFQVVTLGPGTYTAAVLWNNTAQADTLYVYALNLSVFQLGG